MQTLTVHFWSSPNFSRVASRTIAHYRVTKTAFHSGADPNNGMYTLSAHFGITVFDPLSFEGFPFCRTHLGL